MKVLIFRTGKGKCRWADQASNEWIKRIQRRIPVEEVLFKPAPDRFPIEKRRLLESEAMLSQIKEGDSLICLDERGVLLSTEEFSSLVQGRMNRSTKRLVFVIGGPFGHSSLLRKQSWKIWPISVEQISFCVFTVSKNCD